MNNISKALIYVKDGGPQSPDEIRSELSNISGVTGYTESPRLKRLIFIAYEPKRNSVISISQQLGRRGISNCIVDM